jgi:hypothetical protein
MLWPHDQELGVHSLTLICLGAYYQKYTHAEIKNLQKEMAEAVEKHQKDLMEQVQKHQRELADALAARQQEHAHRERLEKQLASQQQELAHCEKHKKDNVNSAQPQHHQREVHPNTLLSNTLMLLKNNLYHKGASQGYNYSGCVVNQGFRCDCQVKHVYSRYMEMCFQWFEYSFHLLIVISGMRHIQVAVGILILNLCRGLLEHFAEMSALCRGKFKWN